MSENTVDDVEIQENSEDEEDEDKGIDWSRKHKIIISLGSLLYVFGMVAFFLFQSTIDRPVGIALSGVFMVIYGIYLQLQETYGMMRKVRVYQAKTIFWAGIITSFATGMGWI